MDMGKDLFGWVRRVKAGIVSRWWGKSLLSLTVCELQVMGASDDLVLDAHVEAVLPLGA